MTAIAYARPWRSAAPVGSGVDPSVRPVGLVVVRSGGLTASRPTAVPAPATVFRRRRAVALLVLVTVLACAWLGLRALGAGSLLGPERTSGSGGVVYVVQPGDTLWSIARTVSPEGDLRPVVDRLVAAHGGATLQVGERLVLPV